MKTGPGGYRGRYAPSPTGDLHFGSLVAAVASYFHARSRDGVWVIRIEDIDPPREVPGSARRIVEDLKRFGMVSDEPVLFQSSRTGDYQAAANMLLKSGKAFWCGCTRSEIPAGAPYPGTCRNGLPDHKSKRSIRLRVDENAILFEDEVQGPCREQLSTTSGDFVIRRADGLAAYQLAVVLDDADQGITHVVRGCRSSRFDRKTGVPPTAAVAANTQLLSCALGKTRVGRKAQQASCFRPRCKAGPCNGHARCPGFSWSSGARNGRFAAPARVGHLELGHITCPQKSQIRGRVVSTVLTLSAPPRL